MREKNAEKRVREHFLAKGYRVQKGPEPVDLLVEGNAQRLLIEVKGDQANDRATRNSFFMGLGQISALRDDPRFVSHSLVLALTPQYKKYVEKFAIHGIRTMFVGDEKPQAREQRPANLARKRAARSLSGGHGIDEDIVELFRQGLTLKVIATRLRLRPGQLAGRVFKLQQAGTLHRRR
jgi:hypothetical protein